LYRIGKCKKLHALLQPVPAVKSGDIGDSLAGAAAIGVPVMGLAATW